MIIINLINWEKTAHKPVMGANYLREDYHGKNKN